jgi:hypothetical protein
MQLRDSIPAYQMVNSDFKNSKVELATSDKKIPIITPPR